MVTSHQSSVEISESGNTTYQPFDFGPHLGGCGATGPLGDKAFAWLGYPCALEGIDTVGDYLEGEGDATQQCRALPFMVHEKIM